MPDPHSIALFMAAALALNLTPGPDMLYVAARSACEGRPSGIVSAVGIGIGTLVHIAAVALGLAALLRAVPVAYTIVRLAGAAYLVYLGIRALRSRESALATREVTPAPLRSVFAQGVLTNVLNPKVALFMLAFLPQFVDPSRGSAVEQTVALGLMFDTSGTIVNLIVAFGASGASARLRRSERAGHVLNRVTGVIFLGLGARIALAGRH